MTPRAYLLLGFLFILFASALDARAESISATATTTVVNTEVFYYQTSGCQLTSGALYNYNSLSAMGSDTATRCKTTLSYSGTFTFNQGNSTVPAAGSAGSIYMWFDKSTGGSMGQNGAKVSGCLSPATAQNGQCVTVTYSCPADPGWSLSGSTCTRVTPVCTNHQNYSSGYYDVGTSPDGKWPITACVAGCSIVYSGNSVGFRRLINGVYHYYAQGTYDQDGTTCVNPSSPGNATSLPSDTCASGFTLTNINGVNTCVSNTTQQPSNPNTPQTPTPAPQQSTTKQTVSNPDGSTTTTETTTTSTGTTKTVVTTTSSDGKTTTSTTTSNTGTSDPASKDSDFCKANPTSPLCGANTATGGGDCVTPPACTGDAIQCAVLNQTWRDRCEASKTNDALGEGSDTMSHSEAVGLAAMVDGVGVDAPSSVVNMNSAINTDRFLATSAGLQDKVVPLWDGRSLTIPLSELNPFLQMLGYVTLICSFISAAYIIGKP